MTLKDYKLNLEANEFLYESECGNMFNVEVDRKGNVVKIYNADCLLTDTTNTLSKQDYENISEMAYNFDYPQFSKSYDKTEKFTY
jgi:hypothetical protein